ncbi:MAG: hypothetical protein LBN00_01095 [Oscillospiraceae bacterium]|jgi:DNA-directed RNA polymerase subunit RPC12/RpoP|nr:hypothetical protein [Oscillospiraceae bacterium]
MALITDVKCGRCDKHYSALRTRCPYCGARRGAAGKHSGDRDDIKGKMIIGIIFLIIILAATAVLLFTSVKNESENPDPTPPSDITSNVPGSDDNTIVENPDYTPPEETPTPPVETPAPVLESVKITYSGTELVKDKDSGNYDISAKVGETLTLKAKLTPDGIEGLKPVWESADATVFDAVPDVNGISAKVTMLKKGTSKLTITVGDKTAVVTVRVK